MELFSFFPTSVSKKFLQEQAREERKRFDVLNPKPYHNKHHDTVLTLEEPLVLTRVQPPL
jgi:hypothetical protein